MADIYEAIVKYSAAHEGACPAGTKPLYDGGYLADVTVMTCPNSDQFPVPSYDSGTWKADRPGTHESYVVVRFSMPAAGTEPLPLLVESAANHGSHSDTGNVLFTDGHIELVDAATLTRCLAAVPPPGRGPASK